MKDPEPSSDRHADAVGRDLDWRAVRHRIGMTQMELSNKLHCNSKTIRRWERGEADPAIAYQRRMLELLDEAATADALEVTV